jgi:hypothetical protein
MKRVDIINGELCFNLPFTFEMAVLTQGPEGARARLRDRDSHKMDWEATR